MRIEVAPGRRLFVDIEGCGLVPDGPRMREKPALVLLHGGPGFDHSGFKPIFSALSDIAQIVYYDHRGHGRSDPCPPEEWQLDVFADDVVRLCDALGITRPIVLGQSFGGFVAQRYLARHPDHPAKVILSSTSHDSGSERQLAMFERLGGVEARETFRDFRDAPGPENWDVFQRLCLPHYNTMAAGGAEGGQRAIVKPEILYWWRRGESRRLELLPGLAAVRCPVLVMAGALDPICPVGDSEDIAAAIPAPWGRLVTFANSGHGAWRDERDAALAVLRDFIGDGT